MKNEDSYWFMESLREHLSLRIRADKGSYEISIMFKTTDGKVHTICSAVKEETDWK